MENYNQEIQILYGLPASGKTDYANNLCKLKREFVRVNKDDIRAKFPNLSEKEVIEVEDFMIKTILESGNSVVVDDTNLNPYHPKRIRSLMNKINKEQGTLISIVGVSFLEVPIEECIRRDSQRPNPVGEEVIRNMYNKWIENKPEPSKKKSKEKDYSNVEYPWITKLNNDNIGKAGAIIVDLDGTIALLNRNPYDTDKCDMDILNIPLAKILEGMTYLYRVIIFVSGREDRYWNKTENWIRNNLRFLDSSNADYKLFMRKTGDNRADEIIKREIYHQEIEPRYKVLCVFDDRPKVRRMWIDEDLFVFSTNQDPKFKEF